MSFSTHKSRSSWYRAREAWPNREAPIRNLLAERARVGTGMAKQPGVWTWESVGPRNVGGRLTSLLAHRDDPRKILVGSAAGGVWGSGDGGRTWDCCWRDDEMTLNIGALAADPMNPDKVYCGTGEANQSADSHAGVGLYVSSDFGGSWQLLALALTAGIPDRIGALAVDPHDSNHLRLGGLAHSRDGCDGLFVSRDGGLSWRRDPLQGEDAAGFTPDQSYRCHSMVFDPHQAGTLYVTLSRAGALGGIWKSDDGGASWRQLRRGLPFSAKIGRTSLAIAPSDPRTLYALVGGVSGELLGVLRTDDGGESWRDVSTRHFTRVSVGHQRFEENLHYNTAIAVHPRNPDFVVCGGVVVHFSLDGGGNWSVTALGDHDAPHADQHGLWITAPNALAGEDGGALLDGAIYAINDGGLDVFTVDGADSADEGEVMGTWQNRSHGLEVTMYYDLEVADHDSSIFGGGTQDNGSWMSSGEGDLREHTRVGFGDGGWMVIHPTDAGHHYVSSQQMHLTRSRGEPSLISPLPADDPERQRMWMVFLAMDPRDPQTLLTGTTRIWRTQDGGTSWFPSSRERHRSPVLDGSAITAIEINRKDRRRIYAGTEHGGFFRSLNGGETWDDSDPSEKIDPPQACDLAGGILPGRTITRIRSHPVLPDVVYVTVGNFGTSHVFRSTDGGISWQDVDRGRLPDVPHHGIAIPREESDFIFVCNDVGVYVTANAGYTWKNLTYNLPNAVIVDLVLHEVEDGPEKTLMVATYGRGLWRLRGKLRPDKTLVPLE